MNIHGEWKIINQSFRGVEPILFFQIIPDVPLLSRPPVPPFPTVTIKVVVVSPLIVTPWLAAPIAPVARGNILTLDPLPSPAP